MSSITVSKVPEEVHRALRVRAAQHGRSTEAEIREILAAVVETRRDASRLRHDSHDRVNGVAREHHRHDRDHRNPTNRS